MLSRYYPHASARMEELSLGKVLTFIWRSKDRGPLDWVLSLCVCGRGCACVGGVSWCWKGEGKMQVWTSHYRVACVLSLIHCCWPCSHLRSFTLLILCLPHLTSLSDTHSHTHTHTPAHPPTHVSVQLRIQAGSASITTIFMCLLFLCIQLRKREMV